MTTKATTTAVTPATEAPPPAPPAPIGDSSSARPMAVHFLKSWPGPFAAARDGSRPYEVRQDDRSPAFEPGDVVVLQEFDPARASYTGSGWQVFSIGYVERATCLPEGWCSFTLDKAAAKQKRAAVDAAMTGKGSK